MYEKHANSTNYMSCCFSLVHPDFFSSSLWLTFILQLEGDDRSDEEEDDSDSPKERNHKLNHINGSGARGRTNREKGK